MSDMGGTAAPRIGNVRWPMIALAFLAWIPSQQRGLANGLVFAGVALLTVACFCSGYVAYIVFTWFFTDLPTVRGRDLKSSGLYAILPFIAVAIASPLSGYVSNKLVPRWGRRIGRCGPAALGMALVGAVTWLFIDPDATLEGSSKGTTV